MEVVMRPEEIVVLLRREIAYEPQFSARSQP